MIRIPKPPKPRTRHYIAAWREFKGLTQEQLAGRIDMSRENLSKIEAGKVPYRQDFLEACSMALGVPKSDLLERDPHMEKMVDELRALIDGATDEQRNSIISYAKFTLQNKG